MQDTRHLSQATYTDPLAMAGGATSMVYVFTLFVWTDGWECNYHRKYVHHGSQRPQENAKKRLPLCAWCFHSIFVAMATFGLGGISLTQNKVQLNWTFHLHRLI